MRRVLLLLGCMIAMGAPLLGHPISMTSAEIDVLKKSISAEIDVMAEDLVLFHSLKSNADQIYAREDFRQAAEKHGAFLVKNFTIRNAEGELVEGRVVGTDLSDVPEDGVAQTDLMKHQVAYSLEFGPLPGETGEPFLTFTQNLGGEKALVPAIMDLSVMQSGIWLDKPMQITAGNPHTIPFDWENPPTAAPKSWRELRERKNAEAQQRLGIASYSSTYSYIYITLNELRHEILVPLLTFEQWLPVARQDPDYLDVSEQHAARERIARFFIDRNPVVIDGHRVDPVLDRLQFFGLDISDFAQNAEERRVSVYQARLGVILSYPVAKPPQKVEMTWETFSENASLLKSRILIDEDPPLGYSFDKDRRVWEWERTLDQINDPVVALPTPRRGFIYLPNFFTIGIVVAGLAWVWVSLILRSQKSWIAAAMLTAVAAVLLPLGTKVPKQSIAPDEAAQIVETLLPRVYGAFERNSEEAIYDALADSVDGELLESLYVSFRKNLEVKEQGGAIAHVKAVVFDQLESNPSSAGDDGYPEFECSSGWRVTGTVEHWGHLHTRENSYEARLKIAGSNAGWKLVACDMRDAKLVRSDTGLRQ
jgi:hypothetical protein